MNCRNLPRNLCLLNLALISPWALAQPEPGVLQLQEIVVTATGRGEPLEQVAATVQVIPEERIRNSSARSVADLLAENAVGFFSEWTPAQTSINLRGGSTDGQGRDFRSQTLVLVNGRRAGTANVSKLSPSDVARIEVVRGPASVAYGSQAMGGVINIITRNGLLASGRSATVTTGSWSLLHGHVHAAESGEKSDFYVGLGAGSRSDYDAGKGSEEPMRNTSWNRRGALAAWGWNLDDRQRLDVTLRSDGVYNAGFPGSSWTLTNRDDRYNQSLDVVYDGVSADDRFAWNAHGYVVRDVDEFNWANQRLNWVRFHNERILDIFGARLLGEWAAQPGTDARVGLDLEYSELRSDRLVLSGDGAMVGGAVAAPYDNDQDERVAGLWGEVVQRALEDRLTLRAGGRYTDGETTVRPTVGREGLLKRTENYDAFTYSLGAAYRATDHVKLRGGYATGFRAPMATELAADFATLAGGQIIGNPDLDNESSRQMEVGMSVSGDWIFTDVAVFDSRISDRIITGPQVDGVRMYINNPDDIELQGLDFQIEFDAGRFVESDLRWRVFGNGTYHFHMRDRGAPDSANTDRPQRIYKYQASVGTVLGSGPWDARLTGILRGPIWYDTEERLLIPEGEPHANFVHEKSPFWVWNVRGSYQMNRNLQVFAGINNLFDKNEHPLFIALNKTPYISDPAFSNGGRGNSMPGREWYAGMKVDF
jgi:vitamin B12 transporter